ncbi:MAG: bifunctional molybdenum cofactor biosynthesis protein MoaC/MoaB [Bacteroidia bacterium]|nr:MAG: bifunctional molybdenum cofactor biosynthesis protein MoaC/MoaB [Bacteroidia bacterium]
MRNITEKITTLRTATAEAIVETTNEIIKKIKHNDLPKKDILPIAKAAGFLAVKNTANVIPHCHPIPIDGCDIDFFLEENKIRIRVIVRSINKTGCEMEALHGASIVALTIYDMLKPLNETICIKSISLLEKTGGKSDFANYSTIAKKLKSAVVVMSDSVSKGTKKDKSGQIIKERLQNLGIEVEHYIIIPDDMDKIKETVMNLVQEKMDLIVTTGGTGLSPRDVTPESIRPLLDTEIPGIMEAARSYGQQRTPYAMLSRGIAGKIKDTLILCLPGSSNGVKESMDALFPYALHIFRVAEGWDHHSNEYSKKQKEKN